MHVLHFIGDFFYNQKGRRSIAGTNQQLQPTPIPSHSLSTPSPPQMYGMEGVSGGGGRGGMLGNGGGLGLLISPRYRPPTLLIIKEIPYKMQHVQD